ncbi:MAG: pyridoxamine 5'-phosphate oxidase family protein [Clostridiales bacterium]|jgi:uncharacterized pyridoxamine 5'-phosphate oxidase family protein|nr:pyridoxamine 5'-phosphate oxidase family protein [Clostridiales bacterium]
MTLQEFNILLPAHTAGSLATCDSRGNPDIRGWQWQGVYQGKIYLCTNNTKTVYKQILANPNIAFFAINDKGAFRVYAQAKPVDNETLVAEIHSTLSTEVKQYYPTPQSNGLVILELLQGHIDVAVHGQSPQRIEL